MPEKPSWCYAFSLRLSTSAFERSLTSVHKMNTAFAPSYTNAAKDGSTHSAASHPLTASAERQLLNTVIPERPVEVEAAGCARWLKPL